MESEAREPERRAKNLGRIGTSIYSGCGGISGSAGRFFFPFFASLSSGRSISITQRAMPIATT